VRLLVVTYCFLLMATSCLTRIDTRQKRLQVRKGVYSVKDTIHISDAILCSVYDKGMFGKLEDFPVNNDSVFNIFTSSLSKLALKIEVDERISFRCDSSFFFNKHLRISKINENTVLELANKYPSQVTMIPFIHLYTSDLLYMSATATGAPVGGWKRSHFVGVVVYVVKENTIIYSRMFDFTGRKSEVFSNENKSTIQQKHWDKLIERVMRDYIKRMK
jgi:hypothetical protein